MKEYNYVRLSFTHKGQRYFVRGKTTKEANAKLAQKMLEVERGEVNNPSNMTVAVWAHEWLETYKENSVGAGQLKNYRSYIKVINSSIGNKRLKDVTEIDLQRILNGRVGNSKSDLAKLRYTIKGIFSRARKSRLIMFDPSEDLTLPAARDGTHRSITDIEREHILSVAKTHRAGAWVLLMLYCGLRPNETRALDWRDIDFKEKTVTVSRAMKAGVKKIDAPKTAAGVRTISLPDELCAMLKPKGPFEPVFTQQTTGLRHTCESMAPMWRSFKKAVDIEMGARLYRNQVTISVVAGDLVPYCLRHTFGTDLQNAGVPLNVAKYLMGHSDVKTTANIYTHTSKEVLTEAAEKLKLYRARDK